MISTEQWLLASQMYARYAEAVDRRRYDELASLFAADAVYVSAGREKNGPEEISAGLERLMSRFDHPTQHVITNVVVRPTAEKEAALRADFVLLLQAADQVTAGAMGSYEARLAWTGDDWAFVRHEILTAPQP